MLHLTRVDEEPAFDNPVDEHVYTIVKDLVARRVSQSGRSKIGKALSDADSPLVGRSGADKAVGRITEANHGIT